MEESSKSVANTAQSVAQSSKTVERGNENGGRGNGREHGTNDERGEIRISGERRGQTVQDSGRKGRSMEEGTGRTEENGRPGRYGRAEKENAGDVFKEAVTAKSLGIEGGTETGKAYILDESRYDDDIKALKEELGQFGLDVVAFEGSLTVENVGRVRGVISGNTVYVKTDAYRYNAYQIGMHEFFHAFIRESAKAEGISRELAVTRLWNRIVDLYDDDAEFENLAFEVYEKLYKDTGYSRERIIEEMLCDMFASMNELELFNVSEVFSQASQKKFYKSARRLMDIAGESLAAELRGSEYFDGFERQAEAGNKPRFSMETVDSDGNRLSEQQMEFFKDSKIRDEEGNLLRVYHGTDTSFTVFDKTKGRSNMDIQGMFFSPWELDAQGYGESVRAYYINIVNPAPEQTAYRALNKFKGQNNAGVKAREYLESLGYDGVNNSDEEYIAFNSNQIKLAENSEPTSDDDIRFSSENDEKLYRQLQDWLKGKGKAHGTYNGKEFDLGMTPKNLIDNGAKKSHLYTFENVIVKITGGKHSIALEEIAKLPSQLADPILLFDGNDKNTLVALTEIKDKEENDVIVTLRIKTSYGRNKATVVTSAYAKSDEYGNNKIVNYVLNQIKAGKLRDVSINKTSNWFTTVGRQLPSVVQTMLDAKQRLAQKDRAVNTFNTNVTNNSDISSTKDSNDTRTSRETYTNISLERFKELEKNNKALEKRVKQLRKRTEHFKAELRQTPKAIKQNPLLDMSVCRKIADRLESGLGLIFDEKGSITYSELVQLIYDMGQANFQTDGWNEETTQKANETIDVLAKKAMEAAMEDTNEYLNEGLDKVKSYLKRCKIYVSPKLRAGVADFGKDYVKKYAGRIIFTYTYEKAYVNVEDVYSELNGMAPGLFPDEIINPS